MTRLRSTIPGIAMVLLVTAGCHSLPPSTKLPDLPAQTTALSSATPATASSTDAKTSTTVDVQAMQKVIADLQQQASALDPASRDRLMKELQQSDPNLWPLVIQQFRAGLAYRQEVDQQRLAKNNANAPADRTAPTAITPGPVTFITPAPMSNIISPVPIPPMNNTVPPPGNAIVQASYVAETRAEKPADYRQHLMAAAQDWQSQLSTSGKTPEAEARLRMLQWLAGQRDESMKSISNTDAATQGFWSAELSGLSLWMDTQHTPDASRRATDARQHLDEALLKLSESCPLVVKNLAFCSKIQSYGCITSFDRYQFSPGQNVLLYAEVENLNHETTPQGIHTSLHCDYQILDSRGQCVAKKELPVTEENCRNIRHDYFVGYELCLPDRIDSGKHTLQLTIEDLQSKKVGQSTIEFTVQ